ncbi:hypothetical protein WA026_001872 [Henosepilachna vigintioctopunctata]|uniref:Peptidoglycan binding-like domain-containing protein n=1 Tax=Henosepilachna vigintioctopunctata TaxID=420089 RepID=A0AAW1USC7_9CUCU
MRFGYLPKAKDGAFALRTEESVRTSLSELQQFAGIPVTGRLDVATVKLLKRPRCGLPDKIQQTSGRRKRFTLQGEKWPYLNLTWSVVALTDALKMPKAGDDDKLTFHFTSPISEFPMNNLVCLDSGRCDAALGAFSQMTSK